MNMRALIDVLSFFSLDLVIINDVSYVYEEKKASPKCSYKLICFFFCYYEKRTDYASMTTTIDVE